MAATGSIPSSIWTDSDIVSTANPLTTASIPPVNTNLGSHDHVPVPSPATHAPIPALRVPCEGARPRRMGEHAARRHALRLLLRSRASETGVTPDENAADSRPAAPCPLLACTYPLGRPCI